MSGLNKILMFIAIAALLLIPGCVQKDTTAISKYIKTHDQLLIEDVEFSRTCVVFACENRSGLASGLNKILSFVGISDLKPALKQCSFEEFRTDVDKDMVRYDELLSGKSDSIPRTMMIGQGLTISAADEGRKFCEGQQGLAIEWLGGSKTENPRDVDSKNAKCAADFDMIPVFLYEVQTGNVEYTKNITSELKDKGPAIIVPGPFYKKGDQNMEDPSCEMRMIHSRCPNCLVGALVGYGDIETLRHYNTSQYFLGVDECQFSARSMDSIDVVLFDLNINEFDCNRYAIVTALADITENLSVLYNKPSIAYVRGTVGPSTKGCEWDVIELQGAYTEIFKYSPLFVSNGLVGVIGADIALMYNGTNQSPVFKSWAKGCTYYYTGPADDTNVMTQTPLSFPKGGSISAPECPNGNPTMFARYRPDFTTVWAPKPLYRKNGCDGSACVPANVLTDTGAQAVLSLPVAADSDWQRYCNSWNGPLRQFTGLFSYDPSVARSLLSEKDYEGLKSLEDGKNKLCEGYPTEMNAMCNSIDRLGYYYSRAKTRTVPVDPASYVPLYLSIVGYKSGDAAFESELSKYYNNPGGYSFDSSILRIIANAQAFRDACGICQE